MDERIVEVLRAMERNRQVLAQYEESKGNIHGADKLRSESLGYWIAYRLISDPEFLEKMCSIHEIQ